MRSRAQIRALVLVAATGLLCAALGAGIARLVADPNAAEEVASAGPPGNVQSSFAYLAIADSALARQQTTHPDSAIPGEKTTNARRAGTGKKSVGKAGPRPADDRRATTGESPAPEQVTPSEPSQSEQGGSSKPSAGSSPGAPADDEEPSEDGPGEDDEDEEPSEDGPGEDDEDDEEEGD